MSNSQTTATPVTDQGHAQNPVTETVQALLDARQAKIDLALAEVAIIDPLRGRTKAGTPDRAIMDSAGGRLANRIEEIGDLELDLAAENHTVTPWSQPKPGNVSRTPMEVGALTTSLTKMANVYKTTTFASVKTNADKRITALLKAFADNGHPVPKDPRK